MLIFSILCFKNKLICWTKQTHCVSPVLFWNCLFITDVSEAAFCLCTQRQSKKQWGQANISERHGLRWTFCLCFVINPWNFVKQLLAIVVVLPTNQVRQLRQAVLYGLLNYTSSALWAFVKEIVTNVYVVCWQTLEDESMWTTPTTSWNIHHNVCTSPLWRSVSPQNHLLLKQVSLWKHCILICW